MTAGLGVKANEPEDVCAGLRVETAGLAVGTAGSEVGTAGLEVGTAGLEVGTAGLEVGTARLDVETAGFEVVRAGFEAEVAKSRTASSCSDDGLAGSRFGRPDGTLIDSKPNVTAVG